MAYVYGLGSGLNLNDLDLKAALDKAKELANQVTGGGGGGGGPAPMPKPQEKTLIPGVPDVAVYGGVAAAAAYALWKSQKK